ncbi:MAG: hypothetical protein HZA02_01695 [Nitrospinae bacterium]|nr:hypothetical protein [Nitrospinota bacterium]
MKREENVDQSLDEIAMDIQWNLQKLSSALDRYYGYEPQPARDIEDYPGPASKNNFDQNQPRDDQGQWTVVANNDGDSQEEPKPAQGRPKPVQGGSKPAREKPKPAKDLQSSEKGQGLIMGFEKFRPKEYLDQGGKRTIGWGHLLQPGEEYPNGILKR